VKVRVRGQNLSLEIDGVRVLHHVLETPLPQGQLGLFSWGTGPVSFHDIQLSAFEPKVFVVMQFTAPYQELFEDVIRPVCKEFRLDAFHAGEKFGPGLILEDIVAGLVESQIIIAEITPANQNVFYELGYAHALKKPTIMLAEKGKSLPFDIGGYRCLFYENSIAGKRKVEDGLRRHLQAILRQDPID